MQTSPTRRWRGAWGASGATSPSQSLIIARQPYHTSIRHVLCCAVGRWLDDGVWSTPNNNPHMFCMVIIVGWCYTGLAPPTCRRGRAGAGRSCCFGRGTPPDNYPHLFCMVLVADHPPTTILTCFVWCVLSITPRQLSLPVLYGAYCRSAPDNNPHMFCMVIIVGSCHHRYNASSDLHMELAR
jgi:hypothetical protein